MSPTALYFGAALLTAITDNAALTYLGSVKGHRTVGGYRGTPGRSTGCRAGTNLEALSLISSRPIRSSPAFPSLRRG